MPEQNTQACLLCGEPLVYDTEEQEMECAICHRVLPSRARCRQGQFVCDDCHSRSALSLLPELCRRETSSDPWDIARRMMLLPQVHMHGPEHHVLVGLALLTAYQNAGGSLDLDAALQEMVRRGKQIPGGACGFLGCCGAAVSAGTFMALATGSTPLSGPAWGLANQTTAEALRRIGAIGGPRCCKRDSFLAIGAAVDLCAAHLGVEMDRPDRLVCLFYHRNPECLDTRCPFNPRFGKTTP